MRVVQLSGCAADLVRNQIIRDGSAAERLTSREAELLAYLAENPNRTVTRSELLIEVWGYSPRTATRAVDSTVQRLRTKIERDTKQPIHILTVQGEGYRFVPAEPRAQPVATLQRAIEAEATAFFGRRELLAELTKLRASGRRLISLVGPPGAGKTRLGREYAGRHKLKIWLCDITAARSLEDLIVAVATGIGARIPPKSDADAGIAQVGHALASRGEGVVILDNFEQVTALAPATVLRWMKAAPDVTFVITSRERLAVRGEYVLDVAPLGGFDGVDLFCDRARLADPSWVNRDHALIEELVARLDGLPLAIELAAARVRVLTPAQILDRLDQRFRLLRGRKGDDKRRATMEGAIDWSWELLSDVERSALAELSVFRGGFTMDAAEAVVGTETALEVVHSLREKSLLRHLPGAVAHQLRLALYESVREYATDRLPADSEAAGRHARWYAKFGTIEALNSLSGTESIARHQALVAERSNLFDATEWAIGAAEGEVAADALIAVLQILVLNGPAVAGRALSDRVLAMELKPITRARVLIAWARAWHKGSPAERPVAAIEEALAIGREHDEPAIIASALMGESLTHKMLGRPNESQEVLDRALALAREHDLDHLAASIFGAMGNLVSERGAPEDAILLYRKALVLASQQGNQRFQGMIFGNLATQALRRGQFDEAWEMFDRALQIAVDCGDRITEGMVIECFGNVLRERGDLAGAAEHYQVALRIMGEAGMPIGALLGNLALLHEATGDRPAALRAHRESIEDFRRRGFARGVAIGLGNLGEYLLEGGDQEAGRPLLEEALSMLDEADALCYAHYLGPLAVIRALDGHLDQAVEMVARASRLQENVTNPIERAQVQCRWGQVEVIAGDLRAAADRHRQATEIIGTAFAEEAPEDISQILDGLQEAIDAKR